MASIRTAIEGNSWPSVRQHVESLKFGAIQITAHESKVTQVERSENNPAFARDSKAKTSETIIVDQSHVGSSTRARSVIDGLEAGVVTLNQETGINAIAAMGKLLPQTGAPFFLITGRHMLPPSFSSFTTEIKETSKTGIVLTFIDPHAFFFTNR
jgi:hypothetical protein